MTTAGFLDVALPAGAMPVTDWLVWDSEGIPARLLQTSSRGDRVRVEVSAVQHSDGSLWDASLAVKAAQHPWAPGSIDAAAARALAAHLLDAADELDALGLGDDCLVSRGRFVDQ